MLVSARDRTTTTYVVHAFFQTVPCDCYAGTCVPFVGSCVCVTRIVRSSFNAHCPGNVPCHDGGVVQHGIRLGLREPRLQRAKLSLPPLSSAFFVLGENADLDSEWACKCTGSRREPHVTGAPVQIIAPAWKSATKQRASAFNVCAWCRYTRGRFERTHGHVLSGHTGFSRCHTTHTTTPDATQHNNTTTRPQHHTEIERERETERDRERQRKKTGTEREEKTAEERQDKKNQKKTKQDKTGGKRDKTRMQEKMKEDRQDKTRQGCVKTTPQKTLFRSVNLYKEFAYRSKIE